MSYGPQLPAWLINNQEKEASPDPNEIGDAPTVYGPVIPGLEKKEKEEDKKEAEGGAYGPMLPGMAPLARDLGKNIYEEPRGYGPSVPADFRPGPSAHYYDESDEEIGPMPVSAGNEEREALERAYRLHMQKEAEDEEKNSQPKREEWMTSVPKSLGNFGLGARTFKKGTASERDATWEDAPGAKKKRTEEPKSARSVGIAAADARQAAIVAEKAAGPTLLELHQKQREEKCKEALLAPGERRPFDREKDMEVRGLKPGGSKDAVEKMKEFTQRFANSKDQRFL